jgi:hypothetical protein
MLSIALYNSNKFVILNIQKKYNKLTYSIKMSETIAIPRKRYSKVIRYQKPRRPFDNICVPGTTTKLIRKYNS